jgi:hypothetical protein
VRNNQSASCNRNSNLPRSPRSSLGYVRATPDRGGFCNPRLSLIEHHRRRRLQEAASCHLAFVASATVRQHAKPRTTRAFSPGGVVRAGVFGCLSAISSTTAEMVKTTSAIGWSAKASLLPAKSSQPRCTAQQTTPGAVRQRNPVRQREAKDEECH